ncbi:MAG: hypothetical protein F4X98_03750 [Gammaproteobacteria bacterium]|nr:hypothetical protein [Gammaproteobacteria bacterium]
MPVAERESKRAVPRVRLALLVALVAVAIAVVWMAVPWGTETRLTDPETPLPEPTAVRSEPTAEATLAGIAAIREDFGRNAALYRLANGATREQIEAWLAELETLPSTPHRYDIARVLYIRFAVLDPEAALDHALQGATRPVWLEAIFRTWAQLDPDAATARASHLFPPAKAAASQALLQLDVSLTGLRSLAERLDETEHDDLYRVFEMSHGVSAPKPAARRLAELEARRLTRRDGESHVDAWNRALGIEDPHVRHVLVEWTALDWASTDPWGALAALDSVPSDEMVVTVRLDDSINLNSLQRRVRGRIVDQWSGDDPDAALAWILERGGRSKGYYIQSPMIEFARRSPDDAITRLAAIPESLRGSATGAVLRTLAYRDLDRALEWFSALDIDVKARHTWTLRRLLIERSAEGALGWAMSVDRRIRTREVQSVLDDIHDVDRPEALRLLRTIDDPALQTAAATSLVWNEVRHDAEQALAWAENFKPESSRSELVVDVFRAWSRRDPTSAYRALSTRRAGPVRDRSAVTMVSDVVEHDAQLAERLFDLISSSEHQAKAAASLVQHFSSVEPDAIKVVRYLKYLLEDDAD